MRGKEWGGRWAFSLPFFAHEVNAREDLCCTAAGSADSCLGAANLLAVQKLKSYSLDMVVAPNSRRKARWSCTSGRMCRQPQLLEHMRGQPAQRTTCGKSLESVWRNVPGQVQVQVRSGVRCHVSGLVQLVGFRVALRPPWRFLAVW